MERQRRPSASPFGQQTRPLPQVRTRKLLAVGPLPLVLLPLVLITLGLAPTAAQANSWCDDIDTGTTSVPLPTTATGLLYLALDPTVELPVRVQATMNLCRVARRGDKEAVTGLATLASDNEAEIRAASLQTLGILGTAEQYEVAQRALTDRDSTVRLKAVFALSLLGCERCSAALLEVYSDHEQPITVREKAVGALAKLRYEPAKPMLYAHLDEAEGNLALLSALALAQDENDASIVTVLANEALKSTAGEGSRVKAILAIETLTGERFGYTHRYFVPTTREQREMGLKRLALWWEAYSGRGR